jgi:hypothetical protein
VKRQNYLDWIRNRKVHDLNILRQLIIDSTPWKLDTAKLDETLFEATYHLKPLPSHEATKDTLNRALNYDKVMDEITTRGRPLKLEGDTVKEQVRSLLPGRLAKSERESLSYALSRIAIEDLPRKNRWPIVMTGLDSLTAAILSIYNVSRIVDQKVAWLYGLWFYKVEQIKIEAIQNILDTLSGDYSRDEMAIILRKAGKSINEILGQDPNVDPSIIRPDNLVRVINSWLSMVESKDTDDQELNKILRNEATAMLAELKGFSASLEREIDVRSVSATRLDVLVIRPDGPAASKYEELLQLFRQEINILQYQPLVRLCIRLAKQNQLNRLTAKDIEEVSQFKGRTAYYKLEQLEHILHERYIPSLRKIGLRYRYIFTPRQRPGVVSDGLVERLILTEQDIRGCSINIEPMWTNGPDARSLPRGSFEAVVEDEILSMRFDLFDLENNEWNLDESYEFSKGKKKAKQIIQQTTSSLDRELLSLTERQVELVSTLWRFEGSRTQRRWLFDQIDFPIRTANKMRYQLLQGHVLNLVYLPALEFCGLPDGLMIVANCYDRRSRDALISKLADRLPFVRLLFGDSNDVVAHARLPLKRSDQVAGTIRDLMKETSDNSFTARLKSSYTYRMTVLHRIRNNETKGWKDPWRI